MRIVKITCAFLCLLLTFGAFCACGDNNDSASSNTDSSASSTEETSSTTESNTSSEVDTRYRATRVQKPADFKYKNVDIMCVGDSITQGVYFPAGYRYYLYEYLYSNGAVFSFNGPLKTQNDIRLPERYSGHAGYGGYKIKQITDMATQLADYDCDIYTLMIGINDYLGNEGENAISRYKELITTLLNAKPDAIIFCCSLAPTAGGNEFELSAQMSNICAEFANQGKKVYSVDVFNAEGWKDGDCFYEGDTVHPNEKGNKIIGQAIGDAILATVLEINDKGDSGYKAPTHVTELKVSESSLELKALEAKTVKATVKPSNAEVDTVIWSSSDSKIAIVNHFGKIRGLKKGEATITATTLDGKFKQEIKVTVLANKKGTDTQVFKDFISSADTWEGSTDKIGNGFTTWYDGDMKTITTKESFDCGGDFSLSMVYLVNGNTDSVYSGNYTTLSYGGYTVKIWDCVRKIELLYGDSVIGTYNAPSLNPERAIYELRYENGKASVIYAGEKIITANGSKPSASKISITAFEKARCIYVSNVILKKINK